MKTHRLCCFVILFLTIWIFYTPAAWAEDPPPFLLTWGTYGTGDGEFDCPYALAIDTDGNIYVGDQCNPRIQKFTSNGTFVTEWGTEGTGNGQFQLYDIYDIAIDGNEYVYVVECGPTGRIQKFDCDGTFLSVLDGHGTGDGQFQNPCGVAVDGDGNIYVADRNNWRVQKFDAAGTFVTKWNVTSGPVGIEVDADGIIYVVGQVGDPGIWKYTSDGTFLSKWSVPIGTGPGEAKDIEKIAMDASGNVYLPDYGTNRIQKFSNDGQLLVEWGESGTGEGQFDYCIDVAVDASGNIYVTDMDNNRIQKFGNLPGHTPPGTDVVVVPEDPNTGTSPVTFTFENVTSSGETSVVTGGTGPPPPAGFRLGSPPTYYELNTTAEFTGNVEICIDYSTLSYGNENILKLFHREDDQWVDRTFSLDTTNDIICAKVTLFSTFAIFELTIGSVAGYVTANCPEPGAVFAGVEIDAYVQGTGNLLGSDMTEADGYYQIDNLEAGDYMMTIVTPLSYAAVEDEIPTTVVAGDVATVNFNLTCLNITPSQRSIGFWKHQVSVATGGNGNAQIDGTTLCEYLDLIDAHFNNNVINDVKVYIPPASGVCADKLEEAKDLLNLKGNVAMTERAKQQLMALLLNVASEKLSLREVISEDGATVSQAITYCDQVIDDGDGENDDQAKDIADMINNATTVPAGMIPVSTSDIAYALSRFGKRTPNGFYMEQNYPNPFNPYTAISYYLPERCHVTLKVYDTAGRKVACLVDKHEEKGQYTVVWNGLDGNGRMVGAGIYFLCLEAGRESMSRKMILLR